MGIFQIFLFSAICVIGCRCQCDLSNFRKSKIVPDIVSDMPEKPLQVTFFNKSFDCGTNTGYFRSLKAPTIQYQADNETLYTLIMLDADAPFPDLNISTTFLHWLIVNIPGNNVNEGQTIASYIVPFPPPLLGPHRYIILIYQQPEKIDPKEESPARFSFNVNAYARSHNLQGPSYGYFFFVGSSLKVIAEKLLSYFSL
ncbi:protein D2-like [Argiope bruennichi]|uniref:protein D2-like n=1 Tax=Argiope bruennichi TaxID=94029 RepID=UPI0024944E1C|nr:protein D2-like [Argiope bruennichi]